MGRVSSEGGQLVQKYSQNFDCCPKYKIITVEQLERWQHAGSILSADGNQARMNTAVSITK